MDRMTRIEQSTIAFRGNGTRLPGNEMRPFKSVMRPNRNWRGRTSGICRPGSNSTQLLGQAPTPGDQLMARSPDDLQSLADQLEQQLPDP